MSKELRVLINDREIGTIIQLKTGRFRFTYDDEWRASKLATPLSLSMPLTAKEHGDKAIMPYLWGLLPDNEATLSQIGRRFNVNPRNPFSLISVLGEDLQGAVQIVPLEQVAELRRREGTTLLSIEKLTESFAELMRDPSAIQFTENGGQFSLAGAQRKKSLYLVGNKWYEPRGRTPSTHILKPNIDGLPGQVENEMFCIRLARKLGLPAPQCWVEYFGDLPVIVVERYDRQRYNGRKLLKINNKGGQVHRVHQEDMCQALKIQTAIKYQRDGGPNMKSIMQLLSSSSKQGVDRDRFMRACAYNFAIAGTDAHAKNYGLLIAPGGRFRLAPLYDIASWLPYSKHHTNRKLAMSVDGEYRYDRIMPRHWQAEAKKCGYAREKAVEHVRDILAHLPDMADQLHSTIKAEGLHTVELDELVKLLIERCGKLKKIYSKEIIDS